MTTVDIWIALFIEMDESVDYIAFTLYTSITIFIALFSFSFVYLIRFPKRSSERELNSAIFCKFLWMMPFWKKCVRVNQLDHPHQAY